MNTRVERYIALRFDTIWIEIDRESPPFQHLHHLKTPATMQFSSTYTLSLLAFLPTLTYAQAGLGGMVVTSLATQMATTTPGAPSLFTVGTVTSVSYIPIYTQTFAQTALGTWAIGPTPLVGSIGLGTIQGTVAKNKRALPTAAVLRGSH